MEVELNVHTLKKMDSPVGTITEYKKKIGILIFLALIQSLDKSVS